MSSERQPSSPLSLPGSSLMAEDFAGRLTPLKEAMGLSWKGLAVRLGVDQAGAARAS